jgi:polyphosphate kinase
MNSLEDPKIIRRLGRASRAGVEIRLLVRGICCLVPGIKGRTETIRVTSIIDRYLEHARAYVFHNNGEEEYFLASADMMRRNLNRRIEVMFPVRDVSLQRELREILDLQFADTVKARLINAAQDNPYVPHNDDPLRSQHAIWQLLADRAENLNGTV